MASVLVTGAGGFIGRALCPALRENGHHVAELTRRDGDISDPATLEGVGPVQHVFHLAARTYVPDSWSDFVAFQKANVLGTANVLEYCRKEEARLTFVSAYLYGVPEQLPVSESCPVKPNNPYALSKHLAEQLCTFYATFRGLNVTVIRPFNIFGPGQKPDFLIPHVLSQLSTGLAINVKDLEPRRDYLYLDDLVDALVKTLDAPPGLNVFNIGSGTSLSVREIIAAIQSVTGSKLSIASENKIRPNEIDDVYADIARARLRLGWSPSVTFRQGIERMMSNPTRAARQD